ncbi:MAG: YdeI/OmpD-associated family protein [Bacteroidota bacterium]|nr:YdeI/OmpD-associated family protein [Bacteroidota bacterium]
MTKKDKRIDAYIAKSADFAKPILTHIRGLIHTACPEVEETMKWSFPHFDYKGTMMCSMASFKQHCAFSFWKASLMKDADKLVGMAKTEVSMGHLGRITSVKDLPSDKKMIAYIKEAMKLNNDGVKLPSKVKAVVKTEMEIPTWFATVLKRDTKAKNQFDAFTPGKRKEYIEWLVDAKTEATREKRLETALEWIAEGKHRHWKYAK